METCRKVPSVECYFVLETVPDLECSPESYEDCDDIVKQVMIGWTGLELCVLLDEDTEHGSLSLSATI